MAIIVKPNTITNGTTGDATQVESNFSTIYNDYNGNITNANIAASAAIADSKLAQITTTSKVSGTALTALASVPSTAGIIPIVNIETVAWTDYASTSTIIGWSSFTTKSLMYKKIGKTVFVNFQLEGTSNSTSTNFLLPYVSADSGISSNSLATWMDNNSYGSVPGQVTIPVSSNTANCYTSTAGGAWTNTNGKRVQGQIWYESAT